MPRAQLCDHAAEVAGEQHPDEASPTVSSVFVVELRAAGSPSSDIHRMHRALMYAVSRLRVGNVAIAAARSVLLPRDSRYLCLLLAADEESVVLACDTAGLSAASIHEARPLPEVGGGDDWWRPVEPDPSAPEGAS